MSNMKAYTDLKQSKILAEMLPHNTADQTYERVAIAGEILDVPEEMQYKHNGDMPFQFYSGVGVPCWSLAALLEIIANAAAYIDEDGYLDATVCKDVHCVSLINCNGELYKADNLVDACYEMILKLHELKLL